MKRSLAKLIENITVKSLASGDMLVEIEYAQAPIEEGASPVGVFSRMAIAEDLQRDLRNTLWKAKK